jgi:molybdopterin biosynthesis enzyme
LHRLREYLQGRAQSDAQTRPDIGDNRLKLIKTEDAVGLVLCHDMTQIAPGKSKETRFRRGYVIKPEDIPVLLDMGRERIYVWEEQDMQISGMLHEEEGAQRLRLICQGANLRAAPVREGKIELFAEIPGLLKIKPEKITALNSVGDIAIMTARGHRGLAQGEKAAALKIIPLSIDEEKINRAEVICGDEKPINIIPYKQKKAGLVITGNEVFQDRIPETGSSIIIKKLEAFPAECAETALVEDDHIKITAVIMSMLEKGLDLIICTGGMSVDPDDKTPLAIKNTGARIVSYGIPLMPGTMLMLAYYERPGNNSHAPVPIIGAPAGVFYEHTTALDVLLPRLMADDLISREELASLGEGGLL